MKQGSRQPPFRFPTLVAGLEGAVCLGPWSYDPATDRFAASPSLRRRLGRSATADTVPLGVVLGAVDLVDRMRIESVLHAAQETDRPFETEFRTRDASQMLWLRLMGRARRAHRPGSATLHGLVFDLTESRLRPCPPFQRAQNQANQLADHVVAMHALVMNLRNPVLSERFAQFQASVGVELARHLRPDRSQAMH